MRTSEETIYTFQDTTFDAIVKKIQKSIKDFESIGMTLDTIELKFQEFHCETEEQAEKRGQETLESHKDEK